MREVIITSIFKDLTIKTKFFDGCFWFKFINLGLALRMPLKFYISVTKRFTLGLIPMFVKVTGEKLLGVFLTPSS